MLINSKQLFKTFSFHLSCSFLCSCFFIQIKSSEICICSCVNMRARTCMCGCIGGGSIRCNSITPFALQKSFKPFYPLNDIPKIMTLLFKGFKSYSHWSVFYWDNKETAVGAEIEIFRDDGKRWKKRENSLDGKSMDWEEEFYPRFWALRRVQNQPLIKSFMKRFILMVSCNIKGFFNGFYSFHH